MKHIMTAAGLAALLPATAGESPAQSTYIEEIKIVTDVREDLELTVDSNNLTCGPKTLSHEKSKAFSGIRGSSYWVVPISSVCNDSKLAKLEKNDVWVQVKEGGQSATVCKKENFKYQTGSGGTMSIWAPFQGGTSSKDKVACGLPEAQ